MFMEESVLTERTGRPSTDAVPATTEPPVTPAAPAAPAAHAAARPSGAQWLAYTAVLAGITGGLAWLWLGTRQVRVGMVAVAVAVLVAALARLILPERLAGPLATRHRVTDVLVLMSLGVCILAVALVLPTPA
jgi:hypothetical protein